MVNTHDLLPNQRPQSGDIVLQREVEYMVVVEWTKAGCALHLHVRSHDEYPEIEPDDPTDCQKYDSPTNPGTLEDLPAHLRRQFSDTARIIKNKYNLSKSLDIPTVCTRCYPEKGDHFLQFTQHYD